MKNVLDAIVVLKDQSGDIIDIFDNLVPDGIGFETSNRAVFEDLVEVLKAAAKWFYR